MSASTQYAKYTGLGGSGGSSGTVTSVSVVSANGLAGTVANPTTTPAITLSTTVTGILKGNGTAISAQATGNLTDVGTDGITVTGGTGAVIGAGTAISQQASDATHNGYLSSTDWSTFNGKQAAGNYITALTGDGTASGPGSAALTFATVNSNVGSFGSASASPTLTVNAKGLVTAASSSAIQIAESQVTNLVTDLAGKQATGNYITALTGDVTAAGPGSVAATIGANKVANSQLAQMAANTIKGNNTGLTANALDLTVTQTTAMLNAMVGDSGSGGTKGLVPAPASGDAAAGKFLKADGTFAVPPGTGGSTTLTPVTKTANYTLSSSDASNMLIADTTSSSFTFTLPAASGVSGIPFTIVKIGNNTLTIARTSSDLIMGETSQTIGVAYTSTIFRSDGVSNYYGF